jgi:hypothetical protein
VASTLDKGHQSKIGRLWSEMGSKRESAPFRLMSASAGCRHDAVRAFAKRRSNVAEALHRRHHLTRKLQAVGHDARLMLRNKSRSTALSCLPSYISNDSRYEGPKGPCPVCQKWRYDDG